MGCKGSDENRYGRHKEIAELLRELRLVSSDESVSSPQTPQQQKFTMASLDGSTSKKDRKAAKRAAKAAERAPITTSKEIERIGQILCLEEPADGEFERTLLSDKSIENNVCYHPGTANSRETRHRIIHQEKSRKFEIKLSDAEMDRIMSEFKVPSLALASSKKERALIIRLRSKVAEDFEHNSREARDTMARKAGFWRWASRKAYNRLIANGSIWDAKSGEALTPDAEADEPEVLREGEPENAEADHEILNPTVTNVVESVATAMQASIDEADATDDSKSQSTESSRSSSLSSTPSRDNSVSSASQSTRSSADEDVDQGWTPVGKTKARLAISTPGSLRLASNGGLGHFQKAKPRAWNMAHLKTRTKLSGFGMLSVDGDGEDSDFEDGGVSPLTPRPKRR